MRILIFPRNLSGWRLATSADVWLRQTYCQHSLHWQTLLLVGSHAAPPPLETVFPQLYALLTVSLVLGLSSRLICLRDICSQSAVHTSDTLTRIPLLRYPFERYKFVTYLLTKIMQTGWFPEFHLDTTFHFVFVFFYRLTWRRRGRWWRVIHSGTSMTTRTKRRRKMKAQTPNPASRPTTNCPTTTEQTLWLWGWRFLTGVVPVDVLWGDCFAVKTLHHGRPVSRQTGGEEREMYQGGVWMWRI